MAMALSRLGARFRGPGRLYSASSRSGVHMHTTRNGRRRFLAHQYRPRTLGHSVNTKLSDGGSNDDMILDFCTQGAWVDKASAIGGERRTRRLKCEFTPRHTRIWLFLKILTTKDIRSRRDDECPSATNGRKLSLFFRQPEIVLPIGLILLCVLRSCLLTDHHCV